MHGDRRAPTARSIGRAWGFFTPGTPLANDAGSAPLPGPRSIDRAKALMREAGYTNQPMRLIGTDRHRLAPPRMAQVGADLVRRLGFNAEIVLTDWGTTVQRRTIARAGGPRRLVDAASPPSPRSISSNPAAHFPLRGNGTNAGRAGPTCRGSRSCATPGSRRRTSRRSSASRGRCRSSAME